MPGALCCCSALHAFPLRLADKQETSTGSEPSSENKAQAPPAPVPYHIIVPVLLRLPAPPNLGWVPTDPVLAHVVDECLEAMRLKSLRGVGGHENFSAPFPRRCTYARTEALEQLRLDKSYLEMRDSSMGLPSLQLRARLFQAYLKCVHVTISSDPFCCSARPGTLDLLVHFRFQS